MPIYTYRCEKCGVQFDLQQSFTDATLTRCPDCEEETLRKVFLPVGIVFKGSGFYATDHRSPSGQTRGNSPDKPSESRKETESSPAPEKTSTSSDQKE